MKEEFFSKFKDYNKELEKILEKKDFSEDTKNLLLSMFYKLEISYNDYYLVKGNCKTKQEYLENILENIKTSNSIEVVKPDDDEFEKLQQNGLYAIDLKLKKIKVIANELALLSAILELNNFQICLNEQYNLIRNSMPYLLNLAYDMENVEVLRDFNAWSWNTLVDEIKDININLIYQNLKIALNKDIFMSLEQQNGYSDVIETIKKILNEKYGECISKKIIDLIFKSSIIIYINSSNNEAKRLLDERNTLKLELEEIKNKKVYIEKITNDKKILKEQLKQIDITINNKDLLVEEYNKRNSMLSDYNKIFSVSHLVEKMQKEREKILNKIEECNKKIEPKTYVENKNKLQDEYKILEDISFEGKNNLYKYIEKLQEIFVKDILINKISNSNTREEIINCMYELRYYSFLPYTNEKLINQLENLKKDLDIAKELLIKKMYENKIINTISTNEQNDILIVKNIFDLKIIDMEKIYIELIKKDDLYYVEIYDEKDTPEKTFELNLEFNQKDKVKLKRKIKLFV